MNGGGVDSHTLTLSTGLIQLGAKLCLLVPEVCSLEAQVRKIGDAEIVLLPRSKWQRIRKLISVIRSFKPDIVHAHHGRDYWPAIIAMKLFGHGESIISRHLLTIPTRHSRQFLLKHSQVSSVSNAVYQTLQRSLKGPLKNLHQIHCGIDLKIFSPRSDNKVASIRRNLGWTEEHVVFGQLGGFSKPEGKGQLYLIQAAIEIHKALPSARFVFAGSGNLESEMREKISQHNLNGIVRILPFTHDSSTLINALDVLVHPTPGSEALGLVLLEAMACAKPVIASNVDGVCETFQDEVQGFFISPKDLKALTEVCLNLGRNKLLRERMGCAGRSRVEALFSLEQCAQDTYQLYETALGHGTEIRHSL